MSKGFQKGRWPLCSEEEDAVHIGILKCPDEGKTPEQEMAARI
jgi:hypothetical protein